MRGSMLEVIHQDFIRTARAKGLSERVVVFKHALRNALIPIVTLLGLYLPYLLLGAVLIETIFAWPGMGRLIVDAIFQRDYPLVMATSFSFVIAAMVVVDRQPDGRRAVRRGRPAHPGPNGLRRTTMRPVRTTTDGADPADVEFAARSRSRERGCRAARRRRCGRGSCALGAAAGRRAPGARRVGAGMSLLSPGELLLGTLYLTWDRVVEVFTRRASPGRLVAVATLALLLLASGDGRCTT
jgi:hypothetical protein